MTLATSDAIGSARELVTPVLQEMVNRLDCVTRVVVSYHFGWCDAHGRSTSADGGKAIRPDTIERAYLPPGPAEQLPAFAHDLANRDT
jgi:geranylgeranyl diphosphate synthase, type I